MSEETIKMLNLINDKIKESMEKHNINDDTLFIVPLGNMSDYGYLSNRMVEEILQLQQENKQLKEELQKADSITQSCIFEGKEESTINFRECLNTLALYKEVIEEVREYIEDSCYYPELENYSNMTSEEVKELVQILDKGVKND